MESFFKAASKRSGQHIENETAANEGELGVGDKNAQFHFQHLPPSLLFRISAAEILKFGIKQVDKGQIDKLIVQALALHQSSSR